MADYPQSVTTLRQWQRASSMYVSGRDGFYRVNHYHPIVSEVARFWREVLKAQAAGLPAVIKMQNELKEKELKRLDGYELLN